MIKQECKLLKILDMLHERGISFALSNVLIHRGRRNTTLLEWIEHRGYTITYLDKNYANSNYQIIDRESKSEEVLITNYHHEIQQGVLFE
jgi:DNA adenine methylase